MANLDVDYFPPLGSKSNIAGSVGDYALGHGLDVDDVEMYSEIPETDVLCLVDYFSSQVVVIKKQSLLEESYDFAKIIRIFGWNPLNVLIEENIEANLKDCFEGMDIILY